MPTVVRAARRRTLLSGTPRRVWPDAWVHHGARSLVMLALALGLAAAYPTGPGVFIGRHEAGTVADRDIIAVTDFDVPKDAEMLRAERDAAAAAVIPTFNYRESVQATAASAIEAFFARADSAVAVDRLAGAGAVLLAAGLDAEPERLEVLADPRRSLEVRRAAATAIEELAGRGVMAPGVASEVVGDSIRVVRGGVAQVVPRSSVLSGREFYDAALAGREADADTEVLRLVLARYLLPTLVPDVVGNTRARTQARDAVQVTAGRVLEGEAIVRENDQIGQAELARLEAYRSRLAALGIGVDETNLGNAAGGLLLNAMVLGIFSVLLLFFRSEVYREFREVAAIVIAMALHFAGAYFIARLDYPGAALPTVFVTVLVSIVWNARLAIVVAILLAAITSVQEPFASADTVLLALAGGSAAAVASRNFRRLSQAWVFIAVTFVTYAVALTALQLRSVEFAFLPALGWAFAATVAWTILAIGFVPVFEWLTGITSVHTLASWADPNRPLVRQLAAEAPGSFSHSLQVANLSEAGANDIGANALLCRAGSYYHDIGKMSSPDHFIENQRGDNPHDSMAPLDSARVIREHVTEGIRMARGRNVPEAIVDFIAEHHGDQTIGFFLRQAVEEADREGREPPDPADFRYPGPRPQTRETAVVMLADSVESAARAMKGSQSGADPAADPGHLRRQARAGAARRRRPDAARPGSTQAPLRQGAGGDPPPADRLSVRSDVTTVHVNAPGWSGAHAPFPRDLVRRAVREALRREGVEDAEVSVTFVGDDEIARLHERHLGLPGPTDVLAFALHGDGEDPLGDVYVGSDQALRQAAGAGVPPAEEMARLAVHGTLHVLGRDHPRGAGREASEMFRVQEAAVRAAAGR